MKAHVTISLAKDALLYVDKSVGKRGSSRSRVIESLIRTQQSKREEELRELAQEFFSQPETPEEAEERRHWWRLSQETLKSDR
jgi:hypothetical protein